jgi:hypothetical protein
MVNLVPLAPFSPSVEVQAEVMAAMTATILATPGHPMAATIPLYRGCIRQMFEEAAAGCGFTLDEPIRISWWRRLAARLVYGYRRLTGQAVLRGGEA